MLPRGGEGAVPGVFPPPKANTSTPAAASLGISLLSQARAAAQRLAGVGTYLPQAAD